MGTGCCNFNELSEAVDGAGLNSINSLIIPWAPLPWAGDILATAFSSSSSALLRAFLSLNFFLTVLLVCIKPCHLPPPLTLPQPLKTLSHGDLNFTFQDVVKKSPPQKPSSPILSEEASSCLFVCLISASEHCYHSTHNWSSLYFL